MKIKMTDCIELHIKNYFSLKSYADVIEVEKTDFEPSKCYVKIKISLDYYISDENYTIVDIDFKKRTVNGFLDLNKAGVILSKA